MARRMRRVHQAKAKIKKIIAHCRKKHPRSRKSSGTFALCVMRSLRRHGL